MYSVSSNHKHADTHRYTPSHVLFRSIHQENVHHEVWTSMWHSFLRCKTDIYKVMEVFKIQPWKLTFLSPDSRNLLPNPIIRI